MQAWYTKLSRCLTSFGFKGSQFNTSIMVYNNIQFEVIILIYVDDIQVIGNDFVFVQQLITKLYSVFSLKYLSEVHYFFGIEVSKT